MTLNPTMYQNYTLPPNGSARLTQHQKSSIVIHHINGLKKNNYRIILIDIENAFDKIQHLFMIKTSQLTIIEGEHPQLGKEHLQKSYK